MQKLKDAISGKDRWLGLESYIELVEVNKDTKPNASLDGAKSILESVSKTILEDKGISYAPDSNLEFLVRSAFNSLPVFNQVSLRDMKSAKSIIGSLENISRIIGEFRNNYGFFSHGQDLQAEKFDRYLVELAISSSDLIASFLITSHSEDLKDRSRVYYEENEEFNKYVDDSSDEYPEVMGIKLTPSRALFSDSEAYKEGLITFVNEKTNLIEQLELSEKFVATRSICSKIISFQEYLTAMEIRRIIRAGIDNPQIYRILGHGYTQNLFTWIMKNRDELLTEKDIIDLQTAFSRKIY